MRLAALALLAPILAAAEDWPNYGNDKGGTRYSPLTQINRSNVARLRAAWIYHTAEKLKEKDKPPLECTPIVIGGVLYLTTALGKVVALDAATGAERWKFDPQAGVSQPKKQVNRGVAYWSGAQAARILHGTEDGRLFSLDANTGQPDPAFGSNGVVDLRAGVGRDLAGMTYGITSAPAVFEDLVILGFINDDRPEPTAPGDIRAFDVRTGRERWRFHTIPRPGEVGSASWAGGSWKDRGGANAWGGLSLDVQRGIVFAGTGAPQFDFYGGDRIGQNLFSNTVLALDARSGQRIWHFQIVRHDLWDYDLPTFPVMVTVRHGGVDQEAVAQVTKTGFLFLLDRATGKPLFDVEERAVPASDVPGEQTWPRQLVPVKPPPFTPQSLAESDLTDISPQAREYALAIFRQARGRKMFDPIGLQPTIVIPGTLGGATWSGASFDPQTRILYVNANNSPNLLQLLPPKPGKPYPYDHNRWKRFVDPDGYPAVKPPWGTLNAIDLDKGEFVWRVTLGEFPELTERGIPPTGTMNFGGSVVTAGGLLFVGAAMDEKMRAFDKTTGRLLWEHPLPAGGYATPCTYSVNGRQYVVIAAGGGGKPGTRIGDAFVAFALPE